MSLEVAVCASCGHERYPPRALCPACGGASFGSRAASSGVVEGSTRRDGTIVASVRLEGGTIVIARFEGAELPAPGTAVALAASDGTPIAR